MLDLQVLLWTYRWGGWKIRSDPQNWWKQSLRHGQRQCSWRDCPKRQPLGLWHPKNRRTKFRVIWNSAKLFDKTVWQKHQCFQAQWTNDVHWGTGIQEWLASCTNWLANCWSRRRQPNGRSSRACQPILQWNPKWEIHSSSSRHNIQKDDCALESRPQELLQSWHWAAISRNQGRTVQLLSKAHSNLQAYFQGWFLGSKLPFVELTRLGQQQNSRRNSSGPPQHQHFRHEPLSS